MNLSYEAQLYLLDEEYVYAALARNKDWMNDILRRKHELGIEHYQSLSEETKEDLRRRAEALLKDWDNDDTV